MLSVRVICVGKLGEKFWKQACDEYVKRLQGYCKPEIDRHAGHHPLGHIRPHAGGGAPRAGRDHAGVPAVRAAG